VAVPILKQGPFLIASIQAALTDTDVLRLQDDVMEQVGRFRSRGIVVDVTSLDVMDSFVSRRLRGAETVIVGIQPEVAFAMVQLGLNFEDVHTALDLEEGLSFLQTLVEEPENGVG
jgi:rsbT antagonist protein RsbS